MGAFADSVRKWAGQTSARMNRVARESVADVTTMLVQGAPVLTGRFMFNWQSSPDTPREFATMEFSTSRTEAIAEHRAEALLLPPAGVYWIVNNVDYASWIEYNHPRAQGHVRYVLAQWRDIVERNAQKVMR